MAAENPHLGVTVPQERIEAFCRRWRVRELSLFGSVLRDDFRPDSDVDVLLDLEPGHGLSLYDLDEIESELSEIFGGREVDVTFKSALRNPFRRHEILRTHRVLYAA